MSELRRLCDLATALPTVRTWPELTTATYDDAVLLDRTSEWWCSLAKRMAELNIPEDELNELECGDWGDST